MSPIVPETLTENSYWDQHWQNVALPVANTLENSTGLARAILELIEEVIASRPPKTVLEVGGAPGGFLAHFARRYGAEIHSLDNSEMGCRKTEENFRLLGYPVCVHRSDLFAVQEDFARFDLVYSLGLIEHFSDTARVVKAHRDLMKPDGLLILGVPHFVEVFWPLLHLLAPRVTGGHNRFALSVEHWTVFEQPLGLKPVRKSYLGGFEPWLINSVVGEEYASYGGRFKPLGRLLMRCLGLGLAVRHRVLRAIPSLGKTPTFDGKLLSAYAMAAYILTRQTHAQPVPH